MDLIQYDEINAFVNVRLDHQVLMKMPLGYRQQGNIMLIQQAVYGQQESPFLRQKDFTASLQGLGFKPTRGEPCRMTKDGIIVFFYVDDIVFACRRNKRQALQQAVVDLKG
ncbi:uncharacterized protein FRV6_16749 [Fusarium oxysporum]|uniref:Reverse transcriptase Ty1/copia-type domain-containing protein n=1 Tax=Fusarium oxysporum TaxID=5507 RepID=A0A2H3U3T7_FUSOX|nr:uncharacterized protein FRV6_16749 [Fusarium oxysporum]